VGKNKQVRKRIAGQQRVIRQHEDKIAEEEKGVSEPTPQG
jgi:hypothetical protein